MIELTLICMCIRNVHTLVNDQSSTLIAQVSGLRKELSLSLPKAQLTQAPLLSASPRQQKGPTSFTFYIVHGVSG